MPPGGGDAENELADLDAALEKVRRRLYAVENGLAQVADPASEAAALRQQHASLSAAFRAAYRRWQQTARDEHRRGI
jgi:hypothetical protein